jgi:hypothetical protein
MWTSGTCVRNAAAAAAIALSIVRPAAQDTANVNELLDRVADRLEQYFTRAQSIIFAEKTTINQISHDLTPIGFTRVLESDLSVEWDPNDGGDSPKVMREIRKVNGHAPRTKDNDNCLDPNPVSPEPLEFLLRSHRDEYTFTFAGRGKGKDQNTLMVDFRERGSGPPEVTQQPEKREGCFSIEVPAGSRGRVWIDASSYEVLRIDKRLTRRVDFRLPGANRWLGSSDLVSLERFDMSIRYKPVAFHDPEESLLLPESINTLTVFQGAQSHRSRQVFSNYRRFVTGGRLVK